jgi:hypothetical protein
MIFRSVKRRFSAPASPSRRGVDAMGAAGPGLPVLRGLRGRLPEPPPRPAHQRLRPGHLRAGGPALRLAAGAGGRAEGGRLQPARRPLPPHPRPVGPRVPAGAEPGHAAGGPGGAAGAVGDSGDPAGDRRGRPAGGYGNRVRLRPVVGPAERGRLRLPRGGVRRTDAGLLRRAAGPPTVGTGHRVGAAAGAGQGGPAVDRRGRRRVRVPARPPGSGRRRDGVRGRGRSAHRDRRHPVGQSVSCVRLRGPSGQSAGRAGRQADDGGVAAVADRVRGAALAAAVAGRADAGLALRRRQPGLLGHRIPLQRRAHADGVRRVRRRARPIAALGTGGTRRRASRGAGGRGGRRAGLVRHVAAGRPGAAGDVARRPGRRRRPRRARPRARRRGRGREQPARAAVDGRPHRLPVPDVPDLGPAARMGRRARRRPVAHAARGTGRRPQPSAHPRIPPGHLPRRHPPLPPGSSRDPERLWHPGVPQTFGITSRVGLAIGPGGAA